MKRLSQNACLIILLIAVKSVTASAQAGEALLLQTIKDAGSEESKAKQLEERASLERERSERRMKQVESEISNQRYMIQSYKARQDQAKREYDMLSITTVDLEKRLEDIKAEKKDFEKNSSEQIAALEAQRSEAQAQQKRLDADILELSKARKKAERQIMNLSMEVQSMKAGVDRLQAARAELESKTAETEADEMRIRTDWMQSKVQTQEHIKQRDESLARLAEAKKRRDIAVNDLKSAQAELAKAQKDRDVSMKTAETEVARMEKEIQSAHRSRIASESEQIRLDAEVAKIREYVARMKESHDQALEQADASEGLVWKSNLNLETARTELAHSVSMRDKENFIKTKEDARARGMAAAAEAAELMEAAKVPARIEKPSIPEARSEETPKKRETASLVGQPDPPSMTKPWITNSKCDAYERPSKATKPVGFLNAGQRVTGRQLKSGWVKLQNPDGAIVYVDGKCGQYEN